MSIHELSQEEYLQKGFIQQTDQNVKVVNNLNEFSNYSTPQPQQMNFPLPQIIYGPQQIDHNNIPPLEVAITCTSDLLKDHNFEIQKQEFIKILIWLIIGSGIEFLSVFFCLTQFWKILKDISPWIFGSSLVLQITFCILSQLKPFKDLSLMMYLGINVLFGISAASFCGLFNDEKPPKEDGIYFTTAGVVMFIVLFQILVNCVVEILVLFQIFLEKNKIRYYPTLLLITVVTMCSMCKFPPFLAPGLIAIFYDLMLLDVLNRTQKGHFKLKINQLFANVNSVIAGIIIPCLT